MGLLWNGSLIARKGIHGAPVEVRSQTLGNIGGRRRPVKPEFMIRCSAEDPHVCE